jgi:N-acetyl-alpha-D-muramate 1-phosphate uridylyltransferase
MILAAGLGTRLRPFTEHHPKALFITEGKTLLEHALDHMRSAGIEEVIINVHHFADQIIDFLEQHDHFGLRITISDETGELLETGGGVKKAGWFLEEATGAVVRNVDVLSDLDLRGMIRHHLASDALATLAVRDRETSRYFLFDDMMNLSGWENRKSGERIVSCEDISLSPYAFSGIQVLSPALSPLITEQGRFSLTSLYLRLAEKEKIVGYQETGLVWEDVGRTRG